MDNATGIRAALARIRNLDQNGRLMTRTCSARHRDRHNTVHECSLGPNHGGYHRTPDGLMFYDEGAVRLRRVPVRAEQYLGKTGAVREIVTVIPDEKKSGLEYAPCTVQLAPDGLPVPLWPGQWVVLFDDGSARIYDRDEFARELELTGEA